MPEVPYQPFATATPEAPGEQIHVSPPPAAFGANVGAALQQLGTTTEQVGGELFQRALQIQDLKNENDARAAQSQYAEQASLLHAQFGSQLQRDASPDALRQYIQAQNDLRNQIRGTLKTAYAQRYYDRDTLPFMQRNIFSAAGHSADQTKQYTVQTLDASIASEKRNLADPRSDSEFSAHTAAINGRLQEKGEQLGWSPEELKNAQEQNLQEQWTHRLETLAVTDPQAALNLADKNKAALGSNYDKVVDSLLNRNRDVGTVVLAKSVFNPDKPMQQMEQEIKDKVPSLSHGDPKYEHAALEALRKQSYEYDLFAKKDQTKTLNDIYSLVYSGQVKNTQDLAAIPGMSDRIKASLDEKTQAMLPSIIYTTKQKATREERETTYNTLYGMSIGDDNQREQFLNTNLSQQGLDIQQMQRLNAIRNQIIKGEHGVDATTNHALQWMRLERGDSLAALGLTRGNPNHPFDADADNLYRGAMAVAVDAWRQDYGKPPTHDEILKIIGPSVIKQITPKGSGWFGSDFFGNTHSAFDPTQNEVNKWAIDTGVLQEYQERTGGLPDGGDLRRAYLRKQFMDLYAKEKPSARPAPTQAE